MTTGGARANLTQGPGPARVEDRQGSATGTLLQAVDYLYDVFDRRVGRAVDADGDADADLAERFVYDGADVLLDFVDADGAGTDDDFVLSRRYLHGPAVDQVLAQENVSETLSAADRVYWLLGDHQNTTRDVVDNTGAPIEHFVYTGFGQLVSGDPAITRYLYTGRELDAATGLQYNWHRWYDAATGRWLSEDPIGFEGGDYNLGRYVGNRATTAVDPQGLAEYYSWWSPTANFWFLFGWIRTEDGEWHKFGSPTRAAQGFIEDAEKIPNNPLPTETAKAVIEGRFDDIAKEAAKDFALKRLTNGCSKSLGAKSGKVDQSAPGQGRSGAFREAKRDAGIDRSAQPDSVARTPMTDKYGKPVLGNDGKPIMTREYEFTRPDGSKVVIQDHSAGHNFGDGGTGDQGPHFNVRPPDARRHGTVPGTKDHYPFDESH